MSVLLTWLINALALLIITYLVPSIHIRSFGTALIVAIVLGLINTFLRPLLVLLTPLPLSNIPPSFVIALIALCLAIGVAVGATNAFFITRLRASSVR